MRNIFVLVLIGVAVLAVVVGVIVLVLKTEASTRRGGDHHRLDVKRRHLQIEDEADRYRHQADRRWDERRRETNT